MHLCETHMYRHKAPGKFSFPAGLSHSNSSPGRAGAGGLCLRAQEAAGPRFQAGSPMCRARKGQARCCHRCPPAWPRLGRTLPCPGPERLRTAGPAPLPPRPGGKTTEPRSGKAPTALSAGQGGGRTPGPRLELSAAGAGEQPGKQKLISASRTEPCSPQPAPAGP